MAKFELGLITAIKILEFRKVNNVFLEQLSIDIEQMKNNNKISVSADKSKTIYMLQQEVYPKLLEENKHTQLSKITKKISQTKFPVA